MKGNLDAWIFLREICVILAIFLCPVALGGHMRNPVWPRTRFCSCRTQSRHRCAIWGLWPTDPDLQRGQGEFLFHPKTLQPLGFFSYYICRIPSRCISAFKGSNYCLAQNSVTAKRIFVLLICDRNLLYFDWLIDWLIEDFYFQTS